MDVERGSATPRSLVSSTLHLRRHTLVQDKPPELGGADEGPMASELLLASLLACQLSTYAKVAAKRGITAGPARLDGALHFDDRGDMERVELDWHFPTHCDGLEAVLRLTDRSCTISKGLSVPVEWHLHCDGAVTPPDAPAASSRP